MKLVTVRHSSGQCAGVLLDDERVLNLDAVISTQPDSTLALLLSGSLPDLNALLNAPSIERGQLIQALTELQELAEDLPGECLLAPGSYTLMAPLPRPSKIICIGLNYMDHCREQNIDPPDRPVLFTKFNNAIIGHGEKVFWDAELTNQVDYEAELAVVIGKRASRVSRENVHEYVFGYTAINDISARDLQFGDGQWVRGKSLDSFCPMGPVVVTKDDIEDPHALSIQCIVNGSKLQDSNTSELIFKIPELIEFITRGITLEAGDVISTGTPHGVGLFRDPRIFLNPGDTVTIRIECIGDLTNPIVM